MQITLHIGVAKTGSSTIQGFLSTRRDELLAQGVLFPVSPGDSNQRLLAAAAMAQDVNIRARAIAQHGPDFGADLARALAAEIARSAAKRMLLSSEHCSFLLNTPDEVRNLQAFLTPFGAEIRVLVYLRRQDEYALSLYSTAVKSGSPRPFALPAGRKAQTRYDYRALLERWGDVFGREALRPRLYQPSAWPEGDLLADFCEAAGIAVADRSAETRNSALSAEALELRRLFNERLGGARDRNLSRAVAQVTGGPKLSLNSDARRAFLRDFDESNRWVAETFFGRSKLFEDVPDGFPDQPLPEITPERFAELVQAVEAVRGGAGAEAKVEAEEERPPAPEKRRGFLWRLRA